MAEHFDYCKHEALALVYFARGNEWLAKCSACNHPFKVAWVERDDDGAVSGIELTIGERRRGAKATGQTG